MKNLKSAKMKNLKIFLAFVLFSSIVSAYGQTSCDFCPFINTVIGPSCNNFDLVSNGSDTDNNPNSFDELWSTFPNGDPATVSNNRAYSNLNSLRFGNESDAIFDTGSGDFSEGKYRIEWMMFCDFGTFANSAALYQYDNINNPNNTNFPVADFAYVCEFNSGNGLVQTSSTGSQTIQTFNYPENSWFRVVNLIDLDLGTAELWINEVFVATWNYNISNPNIGNFSELSAFNIWRTSGTFYIDNFCMQRPECPFGCDVPDSEVCVNGNEFISMCEARCCGYTEFEWDEGTCNQDPCTNFENFALSGDTDNPSFSPLWSTFDPNGDPAIITNTFSNNGSNSLRFQRTSNNIFSDAIYDNTNQINNTAVNRIEWMMYSGANSHAKIGLMENYSPGNQNANVFQYVINFNNNLGTISSGDGNTILESFPYEENTWYRVVIINDHFSNTVEFWVDSEFVINLPLNTSINYLDVYTMAGTFYVDDFCSSEIDCSLSPCVLSSPVCLKGSEIDPCFAGCAGYTEYEWEEGPCQEEECCNNCFDFVFEPDGTDTKCYFFNNFCDVEPLFGLQAIGVNATFYSWSIDTEGDSHTFGDYSNGTDRNSINPIFNFGNYSGIAQICLSVRIEGDIEIYSCCYQIYIPETPCYDPPVCRIGSSETSVAGRFIAESFNSIGIESYHWDFDDSKVNAITNDNGNAFEFEIIDPIECVTLCLQGINSCGYSSSCIEVCSQLMGDNNCPVYTATTPEVIPLINDKTVQFLNVPNAFAFTWDVKTPDGIDYDFVSETNMNSKNPIIEFDDYGCYLVCLEYYIDTNCETPVCMCWTVCFPEGCRDEPCVNVDLNNNCDNLAFDYVDRGIDGEVTYEFGGSLPSSEDEICQWEISSDDKSFNDIVFDSDLSLTYTFPVRGLYKVCYRWWDKSENCYNTCCRYIYISEPYDCGDEVILYSATDNNTMQFSLEGSSFSQIEWFNDNTKVVMGTGSSVLVDIPSSCSVFNISARYFDSESDCWYICCRSVWLCSPQNCEDLIDYYWLNDNYELSVNTNGIDESSITWAEVNTNGSETPIGIQGESKVEYISSSETCGIRTICVRYRDLMTGCWYICCRTVNLCPPQECADAIDYFFDGNTINVRLNESIQINDLSSIEWIQDNNNSIFASGTRIAIPFSTLSESCFTRWISVKYYDSISGCWYYCCRRIRFCPPTNCEDNIAYNYNFSNNDYEFTLENNNVDFSQPIIWSDDNAGTVIGNGRDIAYSLPGVCGARWISVRYFNTNSLQWEICCRLIFICNPFDCGDVISFSEGQNGNTNFSVDNIFDSVEWLIDGSASTGNSITKNLPIGIPVRVCVFYKDPTSDCFYVCCRTITVGAGCDSPIANYGFNSTNLIVEFTNTSITTAGNASYFWNFGDGGTSSLWNPSHTFLQSGSYEVCLTVSDDCNSDTRCQILNVSQSLNTLIFEIPEEVCGSQGDIIWIPITAQNFDNIVVFSKSMNIENPSVGKFIGEVRNIAVNELSRQDFNFTSNSEMSVNFTGDFQGQSINSEAPLYEVGIELLANSGNTTSVVVNGTSANQIVNGVFQEMNVVTRSNSICVENSNINISGSIKTVSDLSNRGIENVEINLTGGAILSTNTSAEGEFVFNGLNGQQNYTITPQKNTDHKNGVDLLDAFFIKHHISGRLPFDKKYSFIAGDTDGSGQVDLFDSFIAKNIFLGNLPNSQLQFPSWRFIKKTDWLELPSSNPLTESFEEQISNAIGDSNDFVGIKIGDINGDATTGLKDEGDLWSQKSSADNIVITASNAMGKTGSTIEIDLTVENFVSIITFSFGLEWDKSQIEFVEVKDINLEDAKEDDFFLSEENDSFILAWTGPFDGQSFEDMSSIVTVVFKVLGEEGLNTSIKFTDPFSARNNVFEVVGVTPVPGSVIVSPNLEDVSVTSIVNEISCHDLTDGSIGLSVFGGSSNFSITWNNGAQGAFIDNLSPGTYQATITDDDSNKELETEEFVIVKPLEIIINDPSIDDVSCFGDSNGGVSVVASGGTGLLSYNWNNQFVGPDNRNLMSGEYTLSVSDENGCEKIYDFEISEPLQLKISEEVNDVSCFNESDGSISVNVSGGVPPYDYSWSSNSSFSFIENLNSGSYSIEVLDANNCMEQNSYSIVEPSELVASFEIENDIISKSASNVTVVVEGGTKPYAFRWNDTNLQNTETAFGLTGGIYLCEVIDANACRQIFEVEVPFRGDFTIQENITNNLCFDSSLGSIQLNISEGSGDFEIEWSTGESVDFITNLDNGIYMVTVTDINTENQIIEEFVISSPEEITLNTISIESTCFGVEDGAINIQPIGGTGTFVIEWSNGDFGTSIVNLSPGGYSATITDSNDCEISRSFVVDEMDEIQVDIILEDVTSSSQSGSVSVSLFGGSGTFDILWSDGSTEFERTGLPIGVYEAVITDAFGCQLEIFAEISDQTVSTKNLEHFLGWEVYPNPTSSEVYIVIDPIMLSGDCSIQIYNLTGQLLNKYPISNSNLDEIKLELDYTAGVYIVLFQSEQFTRSSKIVLTK